MIIWATIIIFGIKKGEFALRLEKKIMLEKYSI